MSTKTVAKKSSTVIPRLTGFTVPTNKQVNKSSKFVHGLAVRVPANKHTTTYVYYLEDNKTGECRPIFVAQRHNLIKFYVYDVSSSSDGGDPTFATTVFDKNDPRFVGQFTR